MTKDYEKMNVSELRKCAGKHGIPTPASIKPTRGVTSDPYAEQGRWHLITELQFIDTRVRDKRNDRKTMFTLIAAVISAVLTGLALIRG